jgi:hypothetical protein
METLQNGVPLDKAKILPCCGPTSVPLSPALQGFNEL